MSHSQRVTHAYHTTKSGHKVLLDLLDGDKDGPVFISFHGGGIVHGSRVDEYVPEVISNYRMLLPSSGLDILEDIEALFNFLPSILTPSQLDNLFFAGFSGGGYPARLAAVTASKQSNCRVRGVVSFYGMGGDFLLDYWLTPRSADPEDKRPIEEIQKEASKRIEPVRSAGEVSTASYIEGTPTHLPDRGFIWKDFHAQGTLPDYISGINGLSETLRKVPRDQRDDLIPAHARAAFPQLYFAEHAKDIPPILLIHGNADPAVPYEESVLSSKTLKDFEFKTIPGANHSLDVEGGTGKEGEEAYAYASKWMLARAA